MTALLAVLALLGPVVVHDSREARAARPCRFDRCDADGECDGREAALAVGAPALGLLVLVAWWWRRRTSTAAG